MSEGRDHLFGRVVGGRYEIGALMAAGGQGAVYAGTQKSLGRDVVIKVLHGDASLNETARARFENEARLAASLQHPHVVALFDSGREDDGIYWLVMERLHGRTLAEALRLDGCVAWPTAVEIARQIFLALGAAHARGIVHRDIKPANVFWIDDGSARPVVKLLDFGLARHDDDPARSKSGLIGTEAYLSPEQVHNERADARSDVFSAGVVFYELITGQNPFRGATTQETLNNISGLAAPPTGEHDVVDDLLRRLLKKDPAQRPDAKGALEILDALVLTCPVPPPPRDKTKKVLTPSSSSTKRAAEPWVWRAVVSAVAVVVVVGVLLAWAPPPTSPAPPPPPTLAKTIDGLRTLPLREKDEENDALVRLGRQLFVDPRLSLHDTISCATCHPIETGMTTREHRTQRGDDHSVNKVNTPSLFNSARHYRQTWSNPDRTIEDVIERPLTKPWLMGEQDIGDVANSVSRWASMFDEAGVPMTDEGIKKALVRYIEYVEPRNSEFDRGRLNNDATQGRALFVELGCVGCHQGEGVGGNVTQKLGVMVGSVQETYAGRGHCKGDPPHYCRNDDVCTFGTGPCVDRGRPDLIRADIDDKPFRVPSLRNVVDTAPYFHDGSVDRLEDAVAVMAELQLKRTLTKEETTQLVAFLTSLSGQPPAGEAERLQEAAARAGRP